MYIGPIGIGGAIFGAFLISAGAISCAVTREIPDSDTSNAVRDSLKAEIAINGGKKLPVHKVFQWSIQEANIGKYGNVKVLPDDPLKPACHNLLVTRYATGNTGSMVICPE